MLHTVERTLPNDAVGSTSKMPGGKDLSFHYMESAKDYLTGHGPREKPFMI